MLRSADKWFAGYLLSVLRRPRPGRDPNHLLFCVADHFEPFGRDGSQEDALASLAAWERAYPDAVAGFADSDGRPPRHTFFYPAEQYDSECLDRLAALCGRTGAGEVEVHLHHRGDTAERLARTLAGFRDTLHARHGCLGRDREGRVRYAFIHGNWALCNSRPDGDWCGVNDELRVLADTGAYADFTFPSAPSPTQPRTVNAVYYARDGGGRPRGHDAGRAVRVGEGGAGPGELMLIQGPLALDWRRRKAGVLPRLENAELSGVNPPTPGRLRLWVRQHVHVAGRPDWVFVKVHAHGCRPDSAAALLGEPMREMHRCLAREYNDGRRWRLHYVTAREMYNAARAAEAGIGGDPGRCRDFEVGPPARAAARAGGVRRQRKSGAPQCDNSSSSPRRSPEPVEGLSAPACV